MRQIETGTPTADPEIGDLPKPGAQELLAALHRHWCESGNETSYQRRPGADYDRANFQLLNAG